MLAREITKITVVPDLGPTPAKTNHETGECLVNGKYIGRLDKDEWTFVLLHEQGHLVKNAYDEFTPDEYAFYQYAKLGLSLKESVFALTRILSDKNPEHLERMILELQRAENYDYRVNHNQKFKP